MPDRRSGLQPECKRAAGGGPNKKAPSGARELKCRRTGTNQNVKVEVRRNWRESMMRKAQG